MITRLQSFKMLAWLTVLVSLWLAGLAPTPVLAAPPAQEIACAEEYTVQADDWLSKIADKFLGDILADSAIFEATNQQHAADPAFAQIANPDLIEIGWQLCIPTVEQAQALLAASASGPIDLTVSNEPLLVAAAANVQFAFAEMGQKFTEQTGQPVEFSFGSSGNLTTQIENGAPFDVFVAANVAFVDRLNEQALIFPETQQLYAQGRIVLAVNREAGVQATSLEDLLDPTITWVAIANPELAPYGQAAKEAMQKAGIWEALQPKLVPAENIGQTLQFLQTGDAPVGIIALAIAEVPEITYTLLPADLHNPLNQSIAVIKSTPNEAAARAFLEFVTGPEGQAILEKYGFQSPGGT
jgi:molybdate transport system substrate-binding protein